LHAADSDAVAATIIDDFKQSCFSKTLAILATNDLFWPIATYILKVSVLF
jgi:hypothetical protein